jgi:hypothetical protein
MSGARHTLRRELAEQGVRVDEAPELITAQSSLTAADALTDVLAVLEDLSRTVERIADTLDRLAGS